jgi:hypothetical protein
MTPRREVTIPARRPLASTESPAPTGAATAPRRDRGLGPFSSGQITAIVIALLLVIGFPVGAFAVSDQNTFLTDAKTGAHAKVSSSASLQTSVSGAVTATAEPTLGSFLVQIIGDGTPVRGLKPPAGRPG